MKLPPPALSAPILCPRCDAPATLADQCIQCALQLRECGNCRGVAGPFDRYCGFCGFELLRGSRRNPLWRLWLLVALVPLGATLAYGVWVTRLPAVATAAVGTVVRPTPTPDMLTYGAPSLGFSYAIPRGWHAIDYSRSADPSRALPFLAVSKDAADQGRAADAKGNLVAVKPQAAVVTMARPRVDTRLTGNPAAPTAVLTSEMAPLAASPPTGLNLQILRPVTARTISDRPAASVLLELTHDGVSYYLERTMVYAPRAGASPMIQVDALAPASTWQAGDEAQVETVIRSIRIS